MLILWCVPSINISQYNSPLCRSILLLDISGNPVDKMILEGPLYELVKDVQGQEFINVGSWKVICERLSKKLSKN